MQTLSIIIGAVTIIVALLLGIMALTLSVESAHFVRTMVRFGDIMLPILAIGALIKYLLCSNPKSH